MTGHHLSFNAPYIPGDAYTRQLARLDRQLYAVHFSLYDGAVSDARVRLRCQDPRTLIDGLKRLAFPRKYLLANGRFQPAGHYRADSGLDRLIRQMARLQTAGVLHGIIFADPYLLKALSDAAPDLAARLEAVPSINFMIDTAAKLASVLALVAGTRFRPPAKITLDRALNRQPRALDQLAAFIRKNHPGLRIELLANEGCLNHCPFRATHEALIAAANDGAAADTFQLNRDLGCMRHLAQAPHRILASPFIRPEDLHRYTGVADIIKICGRTLGPAFLTRTLAAYAARYHDGNLFDLLDAAHWMAQRWELPNAALPAGLLDRLTACGQDCDTCEACLALFQRHARRLPLHLEAFEGARAEGDRM